MPPRKKGGATRKGANADRIGAEPSSSDLPAGDVSGPPETLIDSQAGEVASGASGKVTDGDGKIDPTLADLERAVQQRMTDGDGETTGAAGVVMGGDQLAAATISGDDEMDPAWREIVNSLANAQQNAEASTSAAILGGHLGDHEDGDRLQQTLQTTLDSLTSEGFNSLFPGNYPHSPGADFLLPNDNDQLAIAQPESNAPEDAATTSDPIASADSSTPLKRGRGRPKGSKNKPNPNRPPRVRKPRPKKPTPPPRRPRGRPPKVRDPEAQAAWERKKHERALGIQRHKGRPRKFPGYLVREMRLRKNREEYLDLLRDFEERQQDDNQAETDPALQIDSAVEETLMNVDPSLRQVSDSGHRPFDPERFDRPEMEGMEEVERRLALREDGADQFGNVHDSEDKQMLFDQGWDQSHGHQSLLEAVDAAAASGQIDGDLQMGDARDIEVARAMETVQREVGDDVT